MNNVTPTGGWVKGKAYPEPAKAEPKWKIRKREKAVAKARSKWRD